MTATFDADHEDPRGSDMPGNAHARRQVVEYYTECGNDYRILWRTDENKTIHYGLFDEPDSGGSRTVKGRAASALGGLAEWSIAVAAAVAAPVVGLVPRIGRAAAVRCLRIAARGRAARHDAAQARMTAACADAVGVRPGDRIVDAGCGVGGVAAWLASARGARVLGVNVQPRQLAIASGTVRARGVGDRVTFTRQDYTQLGVRDGAFDVVWGLESICHCAHKPDFVAEAWRVLRPGGRLMVADFFQLKASLTGDEQRRMQIWLDGWAIPNLASVRGFADALQARGFAGVRYRDVRLSVMPSAKRLHKASLVAYPIGVVLERIGVRSRMQTENIRAAFYQFATLRDAVWTYGIFTAEKPVNPQLPTP
jgi:ubiquinone/menaquinone biosynthesis C-methylase UbiE